MCAEQLPPGGYPFAVKYTIYHILYQLATCEITNMHAHYYGHYAYPNMIYRNVTFLKIPLPPFSYNNTEMTKDFEMLIVQRIFNTEHVRGQQQITADY